MILASASPRRQELLKRVVPIFDCYPADIDEAVVDEETAKDYVLRMATKKAQVISKKFPTKTIIGCDTIVVLGDTILGKPDNRQHAREMLTSLSGRTHVVMTATCVIHQERMFQHIEEVSVTFYPLSEQLLNQYFTTQEYADKAGAYGIQGQGSLFVKGIQGDYFSVMGLSIGYLNQLFEAHHIGGK